MNDNPLTTETLDRLYLEWSQFTKAQTRTEIELEAELFRLREVLDVIASPLDINGDDHMAAVKLARKALEEKGE